MDMVTIIEDWNERDGKIYYRWRLADEEQWHEILTAHKQKPHISFRYLTTKEYERHETKLVKLAIKEGK